MNSEPISILDHGAIGDGQFLNTRAINSAIQQAHELGGGRVVVPRGVFLSGTIELRSGVTLHLAEGAILLGSPRLEDYQTRNWGHHDDITPWHLIVAQDAVQIAITGRGTIRGNGPIFWQATRNNEWSFWPARKLERPSPMVELVRCRHVLIEGIRLEDSPGWTLHGHDCDHLRVEGITIRNSFFAPNGDGIDLTGCQDCIIHGCDISTGDDAIALKTTEYSRSCERVAISDCILRTSCVGIRVGYESRQDFRDLVVSNVLIPRCTRVIDLRAIEGATIERVRFHNIAGSTDGGWPATRAIELVQLDRPNVFKHLLHPEHPDYGKDKPLTRPSVIRDVSFSGLDLTTDGRIVIVGKPGQPIGGVRFMDLRLRFAVLDDASPFREVQSTSFIPGDYADARSVNAAFVVQHARDVEISGLRIQWPCFPVVGWRLFESDQRRLSPFWTGHEEAIRHGHRRVPYHVLWARDAEIAVGGRGLHASEDGHPAFITEEGSTLIWRDAPLA